MSEQETNGPVIVEAAGLQFELLRDHREGFKQEAFEGRYTDILNKYDYIVGDWGYNQLRLKGFYDDSNQRATIDTKISLLNEYLYEYCNFGCAYFLLKRKRK